MVLNTIQITNEETGKDIYDDIHTSPSQLLTEKEKKEKKVQSEKTRMEQKKR